MIAYFVMRLEQTMKIFYNTQAHLYVTVKYLKYLSDLHLCLLQS